MTKEYTIKCFILSGILFIYSCAAIQAPPGGPKDIIPPKLVHAVPANGSIYFTGGRVELVFSEYLQENSVHNAIRIQPSLPEPLGIKYKGRTLWVDFPDSLIENQTYIISINRDLRDEHGVQLGQGLQIAYATGSEIDRGEINGKVYYDKPVALHLWMVNSESDLTQFYTSPPDYVTDADNEGNYSFYQKILLSEKDNLSNLFFVFSSNQLFTKLNSELKKQKNTSRDTFRAQFKHLIKNFFFAFLDSQKIKIENKWNPNIYRKKNLTSFLKST